MKTNDWSAGADAKAVSRALGDIATRVDHDGK
jgi:hypothetical protein